MNNKKYKTKSILLVSVKITPYTLLVFWTAKPPGVISVEYEGEKN